MRLIKYGFVAALTGLMVVIGSGCGGTNSSNSQGVSFTLLGFFSELPESGSTDLPTGQLGQTVPLSAENPETQSNNSSGAVETVFGIQNNLSGQFIRADRMDLSYYIEGATRQPPDTIMAITKFLGPSSSSSDDAATVDSASSTLPDFGKILNLGFGFFPIVPPEVTAWLNFNRGILPELPFTMVVTAKAEGVTSAGVRQITNPALFFVIYTADNVIAPTEGEESVGTGDTTEETTVTP